MKLKDAFGIVRGDIVSLIGAGGKTTTLVRLAYELADEGWRVLATSTVPLTLDELDLMPIALPVIATPAEISEALSKERFVFLYDLIEEATGRVHGAAQEDITPLLDTVDSDVLIVEADYSNQLPMKAPLQDEPVIPHETSLVVPMVSLTALGEPLNDTNIYNAHAIHSRYGFSIGERIKSPWVAQVIRDEELGLQGIPPHARVVAFVNQTPKNGYLRGRARHIAQLALRGYAENNRKSSVVRRLNGVAIGTARFSDPIHEVQRPIGAVILAAGLSSRMGEPKMLLPWLNDDTIIEHIIKQLHIARVDHIMVVTGHNAWEVRNVVEDLDVETIYNRRYKEGGMLSSLQAGLSAMPSHIGAAMVVLSDQPHIQPRTVSMVRAAYAEGQGTIIAPSFQMRRGHPILIDRRYWKEMIQLPDEGSPRDVINRHKDEIAYVVVNTDSILRDVDTPQAYQLERRRVGLD